MFPTHLGLDFYLHIPTRKMTAQNVKPMNLKKKKLNKIKQQSWILAPSQSAVK